MFSWQKKLVKITCCLFGLSCLANPVMAQTDPVFVDKELILEIDLSGSIDSTEYDQIIGGYANAFRDPSIQERIEKLNDGLAVGVQFFASGQSKMVSNAFEYLNNPSYDETNGSNTAISSYFNTNAQWFILDTANDANEFATLLDNLIGIRPDVGPSFFSSNSTNCDTEGFLSNAGSGIGGGTNIAGAIQQGTCEINRVNQRYSRPKGNAVTGNAFTGKIIAAYEQAIDISSDGIQNTTIDGAIVPIDADPVTPGFQASNATCNDNQTVQVFCQNQLTTAQLQSANLNGIDNSPDYQWDSPITRINGLPVNNDVTYENEYFANGYLQGNIDLDPPTFIGPVAGGVNKGATNSIADNTFNAGVGVNGSFVISADDYGAFEPAVTLKIQAEVEPVPFEFKPGFGLLLGVGIFGLRQWQSKKRDQNKLTIDTETTSSQEISTTPEYSPKMAL